MVVGVSVGVGVGVGVGVRACLGGVLICNTAGENKTRISSDKANLEQGRDTKLARIKYGISGIQDRWREQDLGSTPSWRALLCNRRFQRSRALVCAQQPCRLVAAQPVGELPQHWCKNRRKLHPVQRAESCAASVYVVRRCKDGRLLRARVFERRPWQPKRSQRYYRRSRVRVKNANFPPRICSRTRMCFLRGGVRSNAFVTSWCGSRSLLLSLAADGRSSDDVIAFEGTCSHSETLRR